MTLSTGNRMLVAAALIALPAFMVFTLGAHSESAVKIDPPQFDAVVAPNAGLHSVVIAGGCFWGIQAVYQHTRGVVKAVSGYAGGSKSDADYQRVSSGRTGHAEAVQITFDPKEIGYGKVLQIFFSVAHNPTELNYQGPDTGTQYRSVIFYANEAQRSVAEQYIALLSTAKVFPKRIVTQVVPLVAFYPAEDYHQHFMDNNPDYPYIVQWDLPKVRNLERLYPALVAAR
jgi:peptide-methionine (S)-S-oxide reductase